MLAVTSVLGREKESRRVTLPPAVPLMGATPSRTRSKFSSNIPVLAVDSTSKSRADCLYGVWVDALRNGAMAVFFSRSEDNGLTWSKPELISGQTKAEAYDAHIPCVAVNKEGVVGVSWYDSRDAAPGIAGWDVRFRSSADGGKTWGDSIRVTDFGKSKMGRGKMVPLGHTAGLVASADGAFHPLWIDGRTGTGQVWTASLVPSTD
jgi:hypothetical protein